MKFLQDYQEKQQTELFNRLGAFFAFSNEQFNEAKKPNTKYVNCGAGLICPKENTAELMKELADIYEKAIQQDLDENGKEAIILRELYNHECFYTGDITACVEKLEHYPGITPEDINKAYTKELYKEHA